jgi:hypothetical protein
MRSSERVLPLFDRKIDEALTILRLAAQKHREGAADFEILYREAKNSYGVIVVAICTLTDQEADLIEPKFTEFEIELAALSDRIQNGEPAAMSFLLRVN